MRSINLASLLNAFKTLQADTFAAFKQMNNISIRDAELHDIDSLLKLVAAQLSSGNPQLLQLKLLEHYYIGYKISQIGKEFDLLRFSHDYIVNIELKSQHVGTDKIKKQLLKNKYYLDFLNKPLYLFTYVSSDKVIYQLNEQQELVQVNLQELIDVLVKQKSVAIDDLELLFNPTNYLISPFNSTKKFLASQYFLTQQQEDIKRLILRNEKKPQYISIVGSPGTGKTLLIYDLAKTIRETDKVLIIHCAALNSGQRLLRQKGWDIASIADERFKRADLNLSAYQFIIIDEAQRMSPSEFTNITNHLSRLQTVCIFSYDPEQYLHEDEILMDIPDKIKAIENESYKLTNTIRTSKEIAIFIKRLFDSSVHVDKIKYSNVEIKYFSSDSLVTDYLRLLEQSGWKVIHYTPSHYHSDEPFNAYQLDHAESAHQVIGQEYDNVVAVLDQCFDYSDEHKLIYRKPTYYHVERMLFQILTRARKKICLVFLNNETVLKKCLEYINEA